MGRLLGSGHAYEEIRILLSAVEPRGLCLDLCTGAGVNADGIREAGFYPVCGDLYPERAKARGTALVQLDFADPLPFRSECFDAILCSEAIEHHPGQMSLLHECARVLKKGGTLVITTPNVLNLRARLSTLLNGHYTFGRTPISEVTQFWPSRGGKGSYFGHVFLASYFVLRFLLAHAGFRITRVTTAKYSRSSLLLAPLLLLPVRIATVRLYRRFMKRDPAVRDEILDAVLSRELLFGKKLVLVARKEGDGLGRGSAGRRPHPQDR
jgi:SAM-dependent methyltransferase